MPHVRIPKLLGPWLLWVPVGMTVNQYIVSVRTISGPSMSPTFNPPSSLSRDVVLLDKLSVVNGTYRRGDVVALWSPSDPQLMITKRIVALEGDVVRSLPPYSKPFVTIPTGHAWVEGDQPWKSRDSNQFGPVPLGLLVARIGWIVWPLNRFGRVPAVTHGVLHPREVSDVQRS